MKAIAAFALGALLASGIAVYLVRSEGGPVPAETVTAEGPAAVPAAEKTAEPGATERTSPAEKRKTAASAPARQPVKVASAKRPSPVGIEPETETGGVPAVPPAPQTPAPATPPDSPLPAVSPEPVKQELAPRPKPRTVTLAAGTLLPVRVSETLSSARHQAGDTFFATLDQALVVDGLVIAERGARAEGMVIDAERAGRVKGTARLAVQLTGLHTADRQKIEFRSEEFATLGPVTKREDAAKVGAAAGIGAAIGAIAGGGKGAAIGAAVGGAAGTGGVMATRGKPAEIPVETRISFRLANDVAVTEQR